MKKTILVVDDSAIDVKVISDLLIGAGYDVQACSNGADGIKRAKEISPCLIVMDLMMPSMNGFQATKILSKDEDTKNIPIIVHSSRSSSSDVSWAIKQGAKSFVDKLNTRKDLVGRVKEYV